MGFLVDVARIIQSGVSVVLLIGIVIAYLSWKSKQNQDRRNAAIGYSLTKNSTYFEARTNIERSFEGEFRSRSTASAFEIQTRVEHNQQTAKDIRLLLAHWEIMSLSIFHEILDEETCFEMVGLTLVNTVRVLENYIVEIRKNPLNSRRYDYVLILYREWSKRLDSEARDGGKLSRFDQYKDAAEDRKKFVRMLAFDKRPWLPFFGRNI